MEGIIINFGEESLRAIIGLTKALEGCKDPTSISDANAASKPIGGKPYEEYGMFQEITELSQQLRDMNREMYEDILYSYVDDGQKYSAVKPCDWGKYIAEVKKAIEKLSKKGKGKKDAEDEDAPKKSPKKASKKAEPEEDEDEDEDPRMTRDELRALAAKASNAGVKVGAILKKICDTKKLSDVPKKSFNALEDALKKAMKELDD